MKSISQSQGSPGHQGVATESGSPCHSCLAVGPPLGTASWLCCAVQHPPSLHVDLWSSWVYCAWSAYLLSIQRVFPLPWVLMMQSVCSMAPLLCHFCCSALALQKIRSVSQTLLVFKSVHRFSVLIWLVQMHKFLFAACQLLGPSRLRLWERQVLPLLFLTFQLYTCGTIQAIGWPFI